MYENGVTPMTVKQIEEIKVAVMEVMNDLQKANQPTATQAGVDQPVENQSQSTEEEDILKIKTGVIEALRDIQTGGAPNANTI